MMKAAPTRLYSTSPRRGLPLTVVGGGSADVSSELSVLTAIYSGQRARPTSVNGKLTCDARARGEWESLRGGGVLEQS
jgi:hypothetical protein